MKGLCFLGEVLLRSPGMRTGDYKKRFDSKPHMVAMRHQCFNTILRVYFRSCLLRVVGIPWKIL